MKRKFHIPTRTAKLIAENTIPMVILSLIKLRILRVEHLKSPPDLAKIVFTNLRKGLQKMEASVAIEEEFIEEALVNWKKGKKFIAIVLYATAVEQYINQTYVTMLRSHGLEYEEIREIIRAVSVEAKLSYFLGIFTKKKFPKTLGKRLKTVFGWRNAIIHFKGIPSLLDKDDDSYSKIEAAFSTIKRLSLSRDYRLLKNALWNIVLEKDPDYDLATKASETFSHFIENQRKLNVRSKK